MNFAQRPLSGSSAPTAGSTTTCASSTRPPRSCARSKTRARRSGRPSASRTRRLVRRRSVSSHDTWAPPVTSRTAPARCRPSTRGASTAASPVARRGRDRRRPMPASAVPSMQRMRCTLRASVRRARASCAATRGSAPGRACRTRGRVRSGSRASLRLRRARGVAECPALGAGVVDAVGAEADALTVGERGRHGFVAAVNAAERFRVVGELAGAKRLVADGRDRRGAERASPGTSRRRALKVGRSVGSRSS